MAHYLRLLFLIALLGAWHERAIAAEYQPGESVGEFRIKEILLRPTYYSRETEGGEFSLGDSSIRFHWQRDQNLSAQMSLGSLKERAAPRFYVAAETQDELGVIEAYADYSGIYGRFRMGLMPLNYGYEGYLPNASLNFNRSQIYLDRYIIFRDFGLSLFTEHNGFYTELIAHNGEGGESDQDGKIWVTSRWGWTNDRHLRIQLSGQAGHTSVDSTASGENGFMGFDRAQSALWRFAAFTVHYFPKKWEIALQTNFGELEQDNADGAMSGEQLDVIHFFSGQWGLGFRYDKLDPNSDVNDDAITNSSLAVIYGGTNSTSRFYLITTKRVEEGSDISSDELRLIWRVTPYF